MEVFRPGQDYGAPYRFVLMVCVNPVERGFEACDLAASVAVLETLKRLVAQRGLSRSLFVTHMGCVLGCSEKGTTIAVASEDQPVRFFKGVTIEELDTCLDELVK